ncbi:MAG: 2-dehydropantoate 2-reductase PanE [Saliniramus fredricksonii]|uniref:2-dehydropantoate 2-reductase n=1 Tax=Saliniramus fredricksonii TaxID=1653334 RepID=A0A0P7X5Y8_9HYPH|nr:2-dehydropantoate 2-reductase [Saliniramus fredricksonii]KPQ10352.1 MAG: 2-dehydropantoate 2-reductase PanE [Saliniramus fredricksonii]SCC79669.1 ketopantoate reductase [Saliniramus fredricksonii]
MRIAIIGTGAMGSVYAGLLGDAGLDIVAIDTWQAHIDAIRRDGLRVSGASGERVARISATTDARKAGPADLVIIATKADGVEAAARAAREILTGDGVVLTIQNGLGSAEKVAAIIGEERTMIGVVGGFGASIPQPGHVHHNGWEFVRLGEYRGGTSARLEAIADIWRKGGFKVALFADIHQLVWEKFICNVAFSGTCTLTGLTIGEVLADADAFSVAAACAREAYAVARAKGIAVDIDDPVAYVRAFGEKIPGARPSMLLDHMAGKRCEIDVINGAVPRIGAEIGVPAPVNTTLAALIRARERAFDN